MKFRGMGDRRRLREDQPIQSTCYACDEWSSKFFVSDTEHPYTTAPGKPFRWIRGRQVGGRSITWGRQSYRWSDLDFEANLKDGIAIDWPIRYADIAPWYDHVERHAGISGSLEKLPQLPDGQFLPPMPLNCGEEMIAGRLKNHFNGRRHMIPGRVANLSQAHLGRTHCQYRDACWLGCPYGAYFST